MKRANGMGTVVKMTGNRRKPWAIRKVVGWKENGRPILKYISYHKTKREAEKALKEYNDDPYMISDKTVADVYDEWYAIQEKTKADGTLSAYKSFYAHLSPLYDVKMQDIDRVMLQHYYDNLDVSRVTLGRVWGLLGKLFDHAVRRGIMPSSAVNLNKTVIIPTKEVKHRAPRSVISKKDIDRLWTMKDDNEYASMILVYIYTGLRFEELHGLTPDCCHDNYIEIKQAKTAAGVRIVPLSDKVISLLPIPPIPPHTTFFKRFKEILPDHVIHDTRHTFITMMTEAQVDARVIKAIVGHKSNDITDIYTHIQLPVMIDAVNKI
jgi:integrase